MHFYNFTNNCAFMATLLYNFKSSSLFFKNHRNAVEGSAYTLKRDRGLNCFVCFECEHSCPVMLYSIFGHNM